MFHQARIRLTLWYLLIIMTISIFFSTFIYFGATGEFDRTLRIQQYRQQHPEIRVRILQRNLWEEDSIPNYPPSDPQLLEGAKIRVLESLMGVNIIILLFSFFAGYFLAGRTLRPIKEMVDEQNRFITDSSHELRTPLTSLRSEIEVALRSKKLTTQEAYKILQSNLEEVISLQILSDNLLELSQNGNFINKNLMEEISLLEIITDAVRKTNNMAKSKNIKIENKVKDIKFLGVNDRLKEVFVILIDNAIKYSNKNSAIEINSQMQNKDIKIIVTDHGMGIEEKDLPYIFDRFYRADKSRTKDGYGLGLSIAKKIVEAHQGLIIATSEPGKQTEFAVILPT